MFSTSVSYQPMEETNDTYDSSVATINPWANYHDRSSGNPDPPEYSSVFGQSSSSSVFQMQPCAVPPGEAHMAQPHDFDYGTITQTGTLNLLAMSEIRLKSRTPMEITCPHCYMQIVTMLKPKRGVAAYLGFVLLILCGCILGCCLIPLYWTPFQDIKHVCPHCQKRIGVSYVL